MRNVKIKKRHKVIMYKIINPLQTFQKLISMLETLEKLVQDAKVIMHTIFKR